jgi:hypothetical protein
MQYLSTLPHESRLSRWLSDSSLTASGHLAVTALRHNYIGIGLAFVLRLKGSRTFNDGFIPDQIAEPSVPLSSKLGFNPHAQESIDIKSVE